MNTVEPIRDQEQLQRFLDYLRRRRERDYVLAFLGFNTGLRISDLLKLTAYDVRSSHLTIRATKTGKRVRVLLNQKVRKVLENYTAGMHDRDFLFPSREGWNKPLTRSRAYQVLNEAAEACGLRHIGCHTLRKTYGFHLYRQTGDVAMLQQLLGHQHPSVTLRYIGITDSDLDEAMRAFSLGV